MTVVTCRRCGCKRSLDNQLLIDRTWMDDCPVCRSGHRLPDAAPRQTASRRDHLPVPIEVSSDPQEARHAE